MPASLRAIHRTGQSGEHVFQDAQIGDEVEQLEYKTNLVGAEAGPRGRGERIKVLSVHGHRAGVGAQHSSRVRSRVVFPAPLGPRITRSSPRAASNERSRSTGNVPFGPQ